MQVRLINLASALRVDLLFNPEIQQGSTNTGYSGWPQITEMKKKRIYVADDDANILELMQMILEAKGYEVITSADGRSLARLQELPDMVFLDIAMSGSDGSEICYDYKQEGKSGDRPVVLVSANTNLHEIANRCGADDVLAKPFDIKAVVDLARKYTEKGNN